VRDGVFLHVAMITKCTNPRGSGTRNLVERQAQRFQCRALVPAIKASTGLASR
jgi:hypothetical protein